MSNVIAMPLKIHPAAKIPLSRASHLEGDRHCQVCGMTQSIIPPISIDNYQAAMEEFEALHARCVASFVAGARDGSAGD